MAVANACQQSFLAVRLAVSEGAPPKLDSGPVRDPLLLPKGTILPRTAGGPAIEEREYHGMSGLPASRPA